MNPTWQQKKLREFCGEKNIMVTAYSPLGAKGASWGSNHVMEDEVLIDIARARGKTVAQVHDLIIIYILIMKLKPIKLVIIYKYYVIIGLP